MPSTLPFRRVSPSVRVRRLSTLAAAALLAAPAPLNLAAQPPAVTREAADTRLAARIDAVLGRPQLRGATWGVEVREAETGRVLYRRNGDRLLAPASNLKLAGAAAAVHHLPPDYRFRTTLYADGEVREGTLHGDLVLYGRGDPNLSARYLESRTAVWEALADSLRARGIVRIAGGVVADESWWDADHLRPDWNPESLRWWYAAPVSALGFNDNSVDVRIEPGAAVGRPARLTPMPASGFYTIENRTTTSGAGAGNTVTFQRVPGTNRFVATGQAPRGGGARVVSVAVGDPAGYAGTVFRETLERSGIAVGTARVRVVATPGGSAAEWARPLVEYHSPPLAQVIDPILRNSQNWFSEQVAKTLGRELRGEGSWDAGLEVTAEFLTDVVGIPRTAFVLRDASGLSAQNRITPVALADLLAYVHRTPAQAMVLQSLPVSADTIGSLRTRMTDLRGRVRAKSGYISGVYALSGYVTAAGGREVVFVVIANGTGGARLRDGIDDVVRAIAAGEGR
jgi:serine-type D-Ala-D-Ala carboxypeptidase/endopeptidase (penicillin-binding protein 4)